MNLTPTSTIVTKLLIPAIASAGLFLTGGMAQAQNIIKIDGSSTVFPATEAVAEEFQKEKKGQVRVTVGISGTGGGFKKFARGETDISDASRPILKEEMELAKQNNIEYIELPVCFDALTVAVNPKNDWAKSMTVAELKKLWEPAAQGQIMKWSQVRAGWPDEPIKLYGAGSDSGTFDYFTEAVVGKAKSSRGDFTGSEDDNTLVQGIAGEKYALGYIPYAYFEPNKNKMKAVAIDGGSGPVEPNLENVTNGKYAPLSRPLFIYVSKKSAERPEVAEFTEFYLTNGAKLVAEVKYLPLPAKAYEIGLDRFKKRATGTAFGGKSEIGMKVEDILAKPLVQ